MSTKHVFSDWMEVEAGYGKAQEGFKPSKASPYGIRLKMHNPQVDTQNPTIVPDRPWEEWCFGYCCVLKVGDTYKCWYDVYGRWDDYYTHICYAESKDGIHWSKPNLGLIEFRGSKENNIIISDKTKHGFGVFYDEDAPEEERYKAAYAYNYRTEEEPDVIQVETAGAVSPDGIHWTFLDQSFFTGGDTHISMVKYAGKYVIYSKERDIKYRHRRTIIRSESEIFGNFPPVTFLKSNDPLDGPDVDYYVPGVRKWPGTEDVLISLQNKFHRNVDYMDLHLELSRNSYEFRPVSREPFIAHTEMKPLNYSMYPSNGQVMELGDGRWAFLITCRGYSHNELLSARNYPEGAVYSAYLREDGFVSVSADSYGSFQSQPLHVTGDTFEINCEYVDCGYVKIEIIDDKDDKTVEGFEMDSCELIERGKIWQEVSWKSGKTLADLDKSRLYRVKFNIHMADIYAYKF